MYGNNIQLLSRGATNHLKISCGILGPTSMSNYLLKFVVRAYVLTKTLLIYIDIYIHY